MCWESIGNMKQELRHHSFCWALCFTIGFNSRIHISEGFSKVCALLISITIEFTIQEGQREVGGWEGRERGNSCGGSLSASPCTVPLPHYRCHLCGTQQLQALPQVEHEETPISYLLCYGSSCSHGIRSCWQPVFPRDTAQDGLCFRFVIP